MNDILHYGWVLGVGVLIGAVFFGGLWWTVRNAPGFANPGLWFAGSSMIRTLVAVGGYLIVSDGNWRNIVSCLAGFLAARLAVTWATRPGPAGIPGDPAPVEGSDAAQS